MSSFNRTCNCSECSSIRSRCRAFRHGSDVFLIEFCDAGLFYEVWVWDCPDDPFGKGSEHHHRLDSGKLCQRSGYESRSLEHAEAFAHWWMKRWSTYIRTGTFPMTRESVDVPD